MTVIRNGPVPGPYLPVVYYQTRGGRLFVGLVQASAVILAIGLGTAAVLAWAS